MFALLIQRVYFPTTIRICLLISTAPADHHHHPLAACSTQNLSRPPLNHGRGVVLLLPGLDLRLGGVGRGGSGLLEGLLEVGDDVVDVLSADGDADEVLGDAGAHALLVGQLRVGGGPGVDGEGLGVADVGEVGDEREAVDDLAAGGAAAPDAEAQDAAEAAPQVAPGDGVAAVALEARVRDPADVGRGVEVAREGQGVLGVALGAQGQRLDADEELLGGEGVEAGAEVAQDLDARPDDEGDGAERLPELEPVVALGGLDHLREPRRVRAPVELAAVDDDAADGRAVPADPLGRRVHHDVGAVLDRAYEVAARAERVVDLFFSRVSLCLI